MGKKYSNQAILGKPFIALLACLLLTAGVSGQSYAQQDTAKLVTNADLQDLGLDTSDSHVLSQKVSLNFNHVSIETLLTYLERKAQIQFSYDKELFTDDPTLTLQLNDVTLEKALNEILHTQPINYYALKGGYVVLRHLPPQNPVQQETITGTVSDGQSGETLPGVNILVKGTSTGASTDADGQYELTAESLQDTLVVSYIGYQTKEVPINGRTEIDIKLASQAISGEEMVVVGYGETSKKSLTSSISTVETQDLEELPYNNMTDALTGQAAGVITQSGGGQPGANSKISIRGGGDPLYVIDDVVSSKADFANLQPEEIEDISILKDVASTAIYGSRASDGIVLVTTKDGSVAEGFKVNYNGSVELSSDAVGRGEPLSSYEYAKFRNHAANMDGAQPFYSHAELDTIRKQLAPNKFPNTQWRDLVFRDYVPQTTHNLGLSGKSGRTNYYLSMGYNYQGSIYKTNTEDFNRFNYRANITTSFDEIGLDITVKLFGNVNEKHYLGMNTYGVIKRIHKSLNPLRLAYTPGGHYAAGFGNVLTVTDPAAGYDQTKHRVNNQSLKFEWTVPGSKGLEVIAYGTYTTRNRFHKLWNLQMPQFDPETEEQATNRKPNLQEQNRNYRNYDIYGQLNYDRTFGKHSINIAGIYTQHESYNEFVSANRQAYNITKVDQLNVGPVGNIGNNGKAFEAARRGIVGRLKYSYADKYLFEGSFRYDGSDNFAKGERWGFFPALSLGWIISEEQFMEAIREKNILNTLKIRASYGKVGNDAVPAYSYLSNYNLVNNSYVVGEGLQNGLNEGALPNRNISWFDQTSYDIGLDFATLNDKVSGTVDYFYYRTSGFLASPKNFYSTPLGKSLPQENSNSARRRAGFEFSLDYSGLTNGFFYKFGVNLTRYDRLWETKVDENLPTLKNPRKRLTHQTDYWGNGFKNTGYYQSNEEIKNSPRRFSSSQMKVGDIRYKDINGDGEIDERDIVRIGNSTFPHLNYGVNFNLSYKGWRLIGLIQGTGPRNIYISGQGALRTITAKRANYKYQLDSWTPDNRDATYPRATTQPGRNGSNNQVQSDFWLQNVKYVRLKNLALSYDLTNYILKNSNFISGFKLILSGTNLLTFTNTDMYDPEITSGSGYGYPIQKTYSFGIDLEF